ncbi:nuclear transport factor 2 family protein [Streptomyces sp. UNOC14_S4]|uniref:YybH family protein n=1 Tax=Streptomyces sp. UNOC14_S4 TaxID=2872340 RepID=UPI001E45FBE7|nr:nuclear transport factor 2 family protein [Streptomyces sp. UNOC14_S4]MCC3767051.1 nuclear transport factor 2 family protein [Streptomyces sp. UNOC14_S4]
MGEIVGGSGALAVLLEKWKDAFNGHRVRDIVELFADDALFQGLSPRLLTGRDEITTYYENVPAGMKAAVELLHSRTVDAEAVSGFATVVFTDAAGGRLPVRLSVVAQHLGDDGWRIRQYHVSKL